MIQAEKEIMADFLYTMGMEVTVDTLPAQFDSLDADTVLTVAAAFFKIQPAKLKEYYSTFLEVRPKYIKSA